MSALAVTVKTNFSPAYSFDPTVKQQTSGVAGAILKVVKPSFDFSVPVLGNLHWAPYGEPNGAGEIGLVVVALLAVYGLYKLLK